MALSNPATPLNFVYTMYERRLKSVDQVASRIVFKNTSSAPQLEHAAVAAHRRPQYPTKVDGDERIWEAQVPRELPLAPSEPTLAHAGIVELVPSGKSSTANSASGLHEPRSTHPQRSSESPLSLFTSPSPDKPTAAYTISYRDVVRESCCSCRESGRCPVSTLESGAGCPPPQYASPVLPIALDYFYNPLQDCPAHLFDAVNFMDLSGAPILTRNEKAVMRYAGRKGILAERFPVSGPQNGGAAHAGHGNWQPNGKSAMHHRLRQSGESFSSFEDGLLTRKEQRDEHATAIAATIRVPYNPNAQLPAHAQSSPSDASFSLGGSAVWVNEETANGEGRGQRQRRFRHRRRCAQSEAEIGHQGSHTCFGVGKDAHFYHTTVVHNDHQLPRKMPLSTFPEDVGEDSLISIIKAFASTTQVSGPIHPHVHIYKWPADPPHYDPLQCVRYRETRHLPWAQDTCRGGVPLRSVCLRASPAYIPGAINPIFKLSATSDLRLDISVGAMIAAKVISPGSGRAPGLPRAATFNTQASPSSDGAKGDFSKNDADNAFPETYIRASIEYHLGETHVRMRFTKYVLRFVRLALRYEEDAYGLIKFGYPSSTFDDRRPIPRLGSRMVFSD
ncbi:hypothetical protein MKEN_00624200 [Mycena kentingensis (nom. inval.)]|nr:hypothetical protein MKEN_00624200 [Mycena kentingensis (nom. inval.)]